jgi:hypothetical protein
MLAFDIVNEIGVFSPNALKVIDGCPNKEQEPESVKRLFVEDLLTKDIRDL